MLNNRLKQALQLIFLALVLVFVVLYLSDQWDKIQQEDLTINWGQLAIAQLLVIVVWVLLPITPYRVLKDLDMARPALQIWRIFYTSNAAKYLPGGIWALPGQVFLYQRSGITPGRGVVAVFWEVLIKVIAAGVVSLLALPVVMEYIPVEIVAALIVAGIITLGIGGLVLMRSPQWVSRLPGFITRPFATAADRLSLRAFIRLTSLYVVIWLIAGYALLLLSHAITPAFPSEWALSSIGVFIGAWLAGFLFILSPGGIGVRDGLIILGLSVALNDPYPAVIAIFARISWTVAEATCLLGSIALSAMFKGDQPETRLQTDEPARYD